MGPEVFEDWPMGEVEEAAVCCCLPFHWCSQLVETQDVDSKREQHGSEA